jgi:hypothetical protein
MNPIGLPKTAKAQRAPQMDNFLRKTAKLEWPWAVMVIHPTKLRYIGESDYSQPISIAFRLENLHSCGFFSEPATKKS